MSSVASTRSSSLIAHRPFLFYFWARGFSSFSYQIATVAVGWQIYAMTHSAFALGMVGLVQFIPSALLVFVAGHAADRYDRQRVVQVCQMVEGLAAAFLAWGNIAGWLKAPEIFAAIALVGTAKAFENPAAAALLPGVVPEGMLQGHRDFVRSISGGGDHRSGRGWTGLRFGARRPVRIYGNLLACGWFVEWRDHA